MILCANYLCEIHHLKCHCENSSNDIVSTHLSLAFLDLSVRLVRFVFFLCSLINGSEIFISGNLRIGLYWDMSIFVGRNKKILL
jgi:hypothetical protein